MPHLMDRSPQLLETVYDATVRVVSRFRPWLQPNGMMARAFVFWERVIKGPLFQCQMCGQCILHSTGMVCPMNCPKQLRNGPCGGVRSNGRCEIKPEMACVWVRAWENAQQMPTYGHELLLIQPPHNWRLHGTSSWVNMMTGLDQAHPQGWRAANGQMALRAHMTGHRGEQT